MTSKQTRKEEKEDQRTGFRRARNPQEAVMRSAMKLIFAAALCFLSPIAALPETLGPRMQQLSQGYHALITNMNHHNAQTTEIYTTAILKQLVAVKQQMSDVVDEMRCASAKEPSMLCTVLLEERRLELEILSADQMWHEQKGRKNGEKSKGDGRSGQKGWVVAEPAEVVNAGP